MESFYLRDMGIIRPILLLLVLSSLSLQAQIEKDKIAHFGLGVLSGGAGAFIASELTQGNRFWTVTGSITASLLAGLAKEAMDERRSNSWDNADLGATVLGGITVGVTVELVSKKNGKRYLRKNAKMKSDQHINPAVVFLQLDAKYSLVKTAKVYNYE